MCGRDGMRIGSERGSGIRQMEAAVGCEGRLSDRRRWVRIVFRGRKANVWKEWCRGEGKM